MNDWAFRNRAVGLAELILSHSDDSGAIELSRHQVKVARGYCKDIWRLLHTDEAMQRQGTEQEEGNK